jgi:hypothetical protein
MPDGWDSVRPECGPSPLSLAGESEGWDARLNGRLDDAHELNPPARVGTSSGLKP